MPKLVVIPGNFGNYIGYSTIFTASLTAGIGMIAIISAAAGMVVVAK